VETYDVANRILLALPRASFERLKPHLEPFDLTPRRVIHHVGTSIEHLYFVNRGLISLVKTMQDGRAVEVRAAGTDCVVGLFALHGVRRAIWESMVQMPGTAFRVKLAVMLREMTRNEAVHRLVERCTHYTVSDLGQTAACNRLHLLSERFCRWLLIAHDSARADTFPLTHEFLALMLGVQRPGLSIAANDLQKAGLIRYGRGRITITNRPGLEAAACECYGAMRAEFDRLFASLKRK
jgi:CRP-like cAMP-binding protein